MNLKTVRVRISNQLSGQSTGEDKAYEISIPEESIGEMHGVTSRMWPDCHVEFKWWGKDLEDNFIYGMPVNQTIDEGLVEEGYMSHSDYAKKWYGF